METGPDLELLKDACAIIDGIPETAINLDRLRSAQGDALDRGTVCSPAGWLAQHPAFMRLGLSLSPDGERLLFNGVQTPSSAQAMATVFGLRPADAERLFGDRNAHTLGDDSGIGDKRLWLLAVRNFLKAHGRPDRHAEERVHDRPPFEEPAGPAEIRAL